MNSGPPHNTPADMALAFAGEPDGPVLAHLHATRGPWEAELSEQIGAENAAEIVDTMIKATMGHKHTLEAMGGGNA